MIRAGDSSTDQHARWEGPAGGQLEEGGLHPVNQLDVDSKESIKAAREEVATKYGRLDVLINNAGVQIQVSDWAVSNIECVMESIMWL